MFLFISFFVNVLPFGYLSDELFSFFLIDCALDLGVVSTADLVKYANGDMEDDNEFIIKTTL